METEKCDKCGVDVEKGTLIRGGYDGSQLRCKKCVDKKPRKPRKRKETPVIAAIDRILEEPAPVDHEFLKQDARVWAKECGLGEVHVSDPSREDFPRYGYGFVMQLMETGGKHRKASARYTSGGRRNFWTIDGMITG